MRPLEGRHVALLESRKAADLSALVGRFGGNVLCVPSVREVLRTDDFAPTLTRLVDGQFELVIVLTAASCDALFMEADRQGVLDRVVAALGRTTLVCRGPKPLLALKRRALSAQIVTSKPHTTDELLEALAPVSLPGARVLLLHYGERSETFSSALASRGARVEDLCLYDWALPDDLAPLQQLVRETLGGHVDAMLFTSQIQFRHLMHVATGMGLEGELIRALRDEVIVGSVGPVCTRALRASGIVPDVMPANPNGPSLIQAVADYFSMLNPNQETLS